MVVQGRKIVKRVSPIRSPNFPPSLKLCVLFVSVVKKSLCPTFADLPSSSDRRRHWDMCGRYRRTTQEEELARMYHIPIPRQTDLPISFNIAPSQDVLAVRYDPEKAVRSLVSLRWGLIPSWAKDEKIGYRTINARMETVQTAPAYRKAFKKVAASFWRTASMNGAGGAAREFHLILLSRITNPSRLPDFGRPGKIR